MMLRTQSLKGPSDVLFAVSVWYAACIRLSVFSSVWMFRVVVVVVVLFGIDLYMQTKGRLIT